MDVRVLKVYEKDLKNRSVSQDKFRSKKYEEINIKIKLKSLCLNMSTLY